MFKKLLFPLFSIFLAYQTVGLVNLALKTEPAGMSFTVTLILAFAINLYVTGVFAFLGFAYPTSTLVPSSYYRISSPKTLQRIYILLGVRYFKTMLLITYWGKQKHRKRYFSGGKAGLASFDHQTRQSEFGHLAAFIAIGAISIMLLTKGHLALGSLASFLNLVANFYPIVLQRMHRMNIERLTQTQEPTHD